MKMDENKNSIIKFFDDDSYEYLEYKYKKNYLSLMSLRKCKAIEFILKYFLPLFKEEFYLLDAGCGPGILLDFFRDYKINYLGVDISTEMLHLARQQADINSFPLRGHFVRGDVENLPFKSNKFDVVISLGVIEYLKEDNLLLTELARILKPNGYLLLAVTNKYSYNLIFEQLIEYFRRKERVATTLNYIKVLLGLGQFKQMDFTIRRHSPKALNELLDYYNFKIINSAFLGFNILPYPFNYFCSRRCNDFANTMYDKIKNKRIKSLGEGYLVLCQNNKV